VRGTDSSRTVQPPCLIVFQGAEVAEFGKKVGYI
jgi:hypothetical protein